MHHWGPGMRTLYILHHVLKGSGYLETPNGKFKLNAGECFFIWPYTLVYYYPDPENPWEYAWVDFEGDNVDSFLASYGITKDFPIVTGFDVERLNTYGRLIGSIDLYTKDRIEADALMRGILCVVTSGKLDNDLTKLTDQAGNERLYNALRLIKRYYHVSTFSVEQICSILNVNKMTLYRDFKSSYNMSTKEFLTSFRLLEADKMLRKGASVKETALSCGFEDPLYFSKVYKKVKGYSPSKLKEH